MSLYSVVRPDDTAALVQEIESQLAQFRALVGREPTHLDSYQHCHREEPFRSLVLAAGEAIGIPVRDFSAIPYCGDFYGQTDEGEIIPDALSPTNLKRILAALPDGVTELGCHPGFRDGLANVYAAERELEVVTLCAPEVRAHLALLQIRLCSFESIEIDEAERNCL